MSVNVLWGEGPLPAPTPDFGGLTFVANLERRCSESRTVIYKNKPIYFGYIEQLQMSEVQIPVNSHLEQIQVIHVKELMTL